MRVRAFALAVTGLVSLAGCSQGGNESTVTITGTSPAAPTTPGDPTTGTAPSESVSTSPTQALGAPKVVDTIATGLQAPWGLDFFANGDAIITERDTRRVLRISGPNHVVEEVGVLSAAVSTGDTGGEAGLLGVAISPDFASDRMLYFYLSTASDNRIVKATLDDGRLATPTVILDGIPNGVIHDGGRLAFGPDGYLYASTGETGQGELAQDRDTLAGKILRITADGDPAPGNPFKGSEIWSYGHRNIQGLAFDDAGRLWASEFGDQTFDELNLIEPGGNYGWPLVEGTGGTGQGFIDPQITWSTDEASPSGLAYADGHLWLAALRGARLWRVDVEGDTASDPQAYFVGEYGRMRTVAFAPDGMLWLTTSNTDGRAAPHAGDDRILLIQP